MILVNPLYSIAANPADAMAAPAMDPIKAWEELLGIPKYQVIKF